MGHHLLCSRGVYYWEAELETEWVLEPAQSDLSYRCPMLPIRLLGILSHTVVIVLRNQM